MKNTVSILGAVACVVTLAGCASSASQAPNAGDMPPAINAHGVMVGSANRMPLYTFDRDGVNVSNCNDACAQNWPPLYAEAKDVSRGDFSVLTRADGKKQWALMGKPLYFYAKDVRPGEATGDNRNGVWHLFRIAPRQ